MAAAVAEGGGSNEPLPLLLQPRCARIVDAFADFTYDDEHGFTFDVFVEAELFQVKHSASGSQIQNQLQINQVRKFFSACILTQKCALRVHWSDPYFHTFDMFAIQHPNASLKDLAEEHIKKLSTFNNPAFRKEMGKANLDKMLRDWPDWVREYAIEYRGEETPTYVGHRIMMDLYAMSRIMKPSAANDPNGKLCNVIYYAGSNHTRFAARICEHLGFTEEWNMGDNPCFAEGSSVRQMPLGVVFEPAAVWTGERRPHGKDAREAFINLCMKHFASRQLVGVDHSAIWFNELTGQTIYFLGEKHTGDRSVEQPEQPPSNEIGGAQDVGARQEQTESNRQININHRNERIKQKRYLDLRHQLLQLEKGMARKIKHMKNFGRMEQYKRSMHCLEARVQILQFRIETARAYPQQGHADPQRIAYDADIKKWNDSLTRLKETIARKEAEIRKRREDVERKLERNLADVVAEVSSTRVDLFDKYNLLHEAVSE